MPADVAAVTPVMLSSMTTQEEGRTCILPAANKKTSGAGFPLATWVALKTFDPK